MSVVEEITENAPPVTEAVTTDTIGDINDIVTPSQLQPSRPPRRRPRRARGYYNDMRYRNPANNPYNPNSPYAFRGRPGQPPMAYRQQAYSEQYYDPYNQYYGYHGYAPYPVQPQQQPYYPYPYPPQARMPQPQPVTSPPPAEAIPDLYYVQKADTPDGQYQYKRVSVLQDNYYENRGRRRPTRWPQQAGYYNYPYNPYDRRPPPPPPQQTYYQPYQYPNQYPSYYYPRVPGVPRSRLRTGKPPLRSTFLSSSWKLTLAPLTTNNPPLENQILTDITNEPSVN